MIVELPNEHSDIKLHSSWMNKLQGKVLLQIQRVKDMIRFLPVHFSVSIVIVAMLLVGVIGSVVLSLQKQENQSQASGTITLTIDSTPQIDLSNRTVTFLVKIVPTGDIPPLVAAAKIHLLVNTTLALLPSQTAEVTLPQGDLLSLISFTPHSPLAFPMEGKDASFAPFLNIPSPSPTPCVSCSTPTPQVSTTITPTISPTPIHCGGNVYNPKACPAGYYCKLSAVADLGGVCVLNTGTPVPIKVLGIETPQSQIPQPSTQPDVLYFSVGDQFSKTVSKEAILADLTFKINFPFPDKTSLEQKDIDAYENILGKSFALTISFSDDSQTYVLNPTGNANEPFVKAPFISQPTVFDWDSIFGKHPTPSTPSHCGGNVYNPKACPAGYYCKLNTAADTGGICLPVITKTPSQPTNVSIFPQKIVGNFTHNILGLSFPAASVYYYYLHSWTFDQIPGLVQAIKVINPGVLRFGGTEDSTTGWDRNDCHGGVGEWSVNGFTYNRTYCPEVIDGIAKFAQDVGAHIVVLGINNRDGNLSMWKDFVHYIRVEKKYTNLSYFEIGNEPEGIQGESPTQYSSELKVYEQALLSVDPSIQIVGPTISNVQNISNTSLTNDLSSYLVSAINTAHDAGKDLSLLSVHWYKAYHPTLDSDGINQVLKYGITDPNTGYYFTPDDWHNELSRRYADIFPDRIRSLSANSPVPPILIDELNAIGDAGPWTVYDSNYVDSLSLADVVGRLQYNGVYGANLFTGFGQYPTDTISMIAPTNLPPQGVLPSGVFLRSTFYPYLLYSQFFGSQMVKTQVDNPESYSVWASVGPQDQHTLKLLVTNFTGDSINPNFSFNNQFQPQQAKIYTVESSKPLDVSQDSLSQNADVTINGQKLDPMNIVTSLNKISPKVLQISSTDSSIRSFSFPPYSISSVILTGTGQQGNSEPTSVMIGNPTGDTSTAVPNTVSFQMILACLDLKKPMSDPTSNYNSTACKAFPNRADADLNHDGWINGVDLNLYYRSHK